MKEALACPRCGTPLDAGGQCRRCRPVPGARQKTVVVPSQRRIDGIASPEPAGEELAAVPIPTGWEISLDAIEGPNSGTAYRVTRSRVLIGRGAVEVPLDDPKASRRHASLEVYGGALVLLKDLGSTNGTYVNAQRVDFVQLEDGDEIRIGSTKLAVTISAPPSSD